jgi:hypothetical protein
MLALLCAATAPFFLGVDTILTMNAFDPIFWMGCVWSFIRILKTGSPRWWLMFGVAAGLGLENKESIVFLGAALLLGLALTPQRNKLFTIWFLLGGLVAVLIALPTALWQLNHHFPMLEELSNVKASGKNAPVSLLSFLIGQVMIMGFVACVVWVAGLWFFAATERGRQYRAIALAYLAMYLAFVMLKGKVYYLAPIYPVLLAAGAVWLEEVSARQWRLALRWALPLLIFASNAVAAPMAIPMLPVESFIKYEQVLGIETRGRLNPVKVAVTETRELAELPQIYADMFGWEEMVAAVAKVYNSLPPTERANAAIYTINYGEAGAIDFLGPRYGLPKAISGHMNYYLWGPRNYDGTVVIAVGGYEADYRRTHGSVEYATTVGTRYSMPDEHAGIWICRNPKVPMEKLWPLAKIYR